MDFRRDSMAQDVPTRGVEPGELKSLLLGEFLPDALGMGPHLVHDDGGIGSEKVKKMPLTAKILQSFCSSVPLLNRMAAMDVQS